MRGAIARSGPDAVVAFTYNSSAAVLERASFTEAFFAAVGATIAEHTICAATMGPWDSVFGEMASADPRGGAQQVGGRLGRQPDGEQHSPFTASLVQQAAKAEYQGGGDRSAGDGHEGRRADLHLAIRPGTGAVLALAVASHWAATGRLAHEFIAAHADGAEALLAAAASGRSIVPRVTGLAAADIDACRVVGHHSAHDTAHRVGTGAQQQRWCGLPCHPLPCRFWAATSCSGAAVSSAPPRPAQPSRCTRWPQEAFSGLRRSLPLHQVASGWRRARPTRARCCSCRAPTRW